MIARRLRWLLPAFFSLAALFTHAQVKAAMSGPVSIPIQSFIHTTSTVQESPMGPGGWVIDTYHYWTAPFISMNNQGLTTANWGAAAADRAYVDYSYATATANHIIYYNVCEQSYGGSTLICNGANGANTQGWHEATGPAFSGLAAKGASGSVWDYYYVIVTAAPRGNWTTNDRTVNIPTLLGMGVD
jgi:hypothetical protein